MAQIGILKGIGDERRIFPNHFKGDERVKTVLGHSISPDKQAVWYNDLWMPFSDYKTIVSAENNLEEVK